MNRQIQEMKRGTYKLQEIFARYVSMRCLLVITIFSACCNVGSTFACDCVAQSDVGFINSGELGSSVGERHLPANARGVLFLASWYVNAINGYDRTPVKEDTATLTPDLFSIKEKETGQMLTPILKYLDVDAQMGNVDHDSKTSVELGGKSKIPDSAPFFLRKLYRVEPKDGFKPGSNYVVTFRGHLWWSQMKYPRHVEVHIDETPMASGDHLFLLDLSGKPTRELLTKAGTSMCSYPSASIVQKLSYAIPPAYEGYRDSILFFTQQQFNVNDASLSGITDGRYTPTIYHSSTCESPAYGKSEIGLGKEIAYTDCKVGGDSMSSRNVKGFVGLLEVEDRLHETPPTKIAFGQASGSGCDNVSVVKSAIESGDADSLRSTICSVATVPSQQRGGFTDIRRQIFSLTQHTDNRIRVCSFDVYVTSPEFKPSNQIIESLAGSMSGALADSSIDIRHQAAQKLIHLIDMAKESDRAAEKASAPLPNMAIFRSIILPVAKGLSNDDWTTRKDAATILEKIGPEARTAQPALLMAIADKTKENDEAVFALAAISPDDPHVLAALIAETNNKVSCGHGRELTVLINIAPNDPQVENALITALNDASYSTSDVAADLIAHHATTEIQTKAIAILSARANADDVSAISGLGKMGRVAYAALPLLIDKARNAKEITERKFAVAALGKVSAGEPEALAAINENILSAENDEIREQALKALSDLGIKSRSSVPMLQNLARNHNLSATEMYLIERAIHSMDFPAGEEEKLIRSLVTR